MAENDYLKLDNQLCFALYASSREMIKMYRPLLDDLGLTYPQYLVLLVLWENDGVTVNTIGDLLHLDSGTLTPLLKRLEKSDILERRRSEDDERRVEIFLTQKGKELKEKAAHVPEEMFCTSGLKPEEFMKLKDMLYGLMKTMKECSED